MSVTIRDIAIEAGVSPSTVSLVLNHKGEIGEDTRIKVLRAAEKLNYSISRNRKKQESKPLIGFLKIQKHGNILNREHSVFIADYIAGMDKCARIEGCHFDIHSYDSFDWKRIESDLEISPFSGAIILATELSREDVSLFEGVDLPLVIIDAIYDGLPFDFIDMDNEGAVYSVITSLRERDYQHIGLVRSSTPTSNFDLRERAFHHHLGNGEFIYTVGATFDRAYRDFKKILESGSQLPDVLFCLSDIMALGCMKALREKNITVPDQVGIVGFDDIPSGLFSDPPLSSVKVSKIRMGQKAIERILEKIKNKENMSREVIKICGEMVIRESI